MAYTDPRIPVPKASNSKRPSKKGNYFGSTNMPILAYNPTNQSNQFYSGTSASVGGGWNRQANQFGYTPPVPPASGSSNLYNRNQYYVPTLPGASNPYAYGGSTYGVPNSSLYARNQYYVPGAPFAPDVNNPVNNWWEAGGYNEYGQPLGTTAPYGQSGGPPRLGGSTQTTMTPEQIQQQIAELQTQLSNFQFNDMSTDVKNVSYGKLIGAGSSRRYKLLNKRLGMFNKFNEINNPVGTGAGTSPAWYGQLVNFNVG